MSRLGQAPALRSGAERPCAATSRLRARYSDQIDRAVGFEGLRAIALVHEPLCFGEGQMTVCCQFGQGHPFRLHVCLHEMQITEAGCFGFTRRGANVGRTLDLPVESDSNRPATNRLGTTRSMLSQTVRAPPRRRASAKPRCRSTGRDLACCCLIVAPRWSARRELRAPVWHRRFGQVFCRPGKYSWSGNIGVDLSR